MMVTKKKTVKEVVKARAVEPSTWAGGAAILEGLKFVLPQYGALLQGLQVMAGGLAIAMREKGGA